MKHLLLIGFAFLALNASAQTPKVDTVYKAVQIQPLVANAIKKDTAYQMIWMVNNVYRNDSLPGIAYVRFFDRKGRQVMQDEVLVPASVLAVWLSNTVIDDFILSFYSLTKR